MDHFDVIVVGVGAMGSPACFELARRGVRVLGIEQFDVPNELGSSHGLSRMIRLSYYEHPDYVPLLMRAYERWEELEKLSGEKLLHLTGGLYMGPVGCELVEGSARAAREHGLEHEMLDGGRINKRFGVFTVPADWMGLLEERAGFLLPEQVIKAYAHLARARSAEIHEREKLVEWSSDGSGVWVKTERGEYRAGKIVFCGGAWAGQLLRDLKIGLTVTRQVLLWFDALRRREFELGKIPVWAIERSGGGLYYGLPVMAGEKGVKISCHWPGEKTDPDHVARELQEGEEREVAEIATTYLPGATGRVVDYRVCMYTNSPDSHFIIDKHPNDERVVLACGFSGHGFKFASVVGEILADLALTGRTALPAKFLGLDRFR